MSFHYAPYDEDLLFVPLGGANEIGMNLNLYRTRGKWLMVDLGIGFAGHHLPGIDVVVPNIDAITPFKNDLVGLVLTHAHEDHLGAVTTLWPELGCPIYATAFTAAVLCAKLAEEGLQGKVKIHEVKTGVRYELGPFAIELVPITHSIPEMSAVAIESPRGTVLHTGDWKLDANPLVGVTTDEDALRRYGDRGVLAMVCDSTNVFVEGESGSELHVRQNLTEIIAGCEGRAVVTTFSSNIARLETILYAARDAGRSVALAGRAIWRMVHAAQSAGYLRDVPELLSDTQGMQLPRERVVFVCTGCQGEPRAAMSKIARGEHPAIRLSPGDTVLFSSRTIPGNEEEVGYLMNRLVAQGIEIITDKLGFIHVSGHPARLELERMYQLVRPQIAVPVHGEARHIHEHARYARQLQVPHTIEPSNGVVINLTAPHPGIIGKVESGYLGLDGTSLIDTSSPVFKNRRKLRDEGIVMVSLVLSKRGELSGAVQISAPGVLDASEDQALLAEIAGAVAEVVRKPTRASGGKMKAMEDAVRACVRKLIRDELGKSPLLEVHVHAMG